MKIIAIANLKGGVGKTTVAANLAYCLAAAGAQVLAVDLDTQGNLAQGLGVEGPGDGKSPLGDALLYTEDISQAAKDSAWPGLRIVPSDGVMMETCVARLTERWHKHQALGRALDGCPAEVAIIDCPPQLGTLTVSALCAADMVIAPVTPGRYSPEGLARLIQVGRELAAEGMRPQSCPIRVLINQWSPRRAAAGWLEKQLEPVAYLAMKARIRQNAAITNAAILRQPVAVAAPRSNGAKDFEALAKEIQAWLV